jgi:hypothetical protein
MVEVATVATKLIECLRLAQELGRGQGVADLLKRRVPKGGIFGKNDTNELGFHEAVGMLCDAIAPGVQ